MTKEIIDSQLSRAQALDGTGITDPRLRDFHEAMTPLLAVVEVRTHGFDGKPHLGQLVVHHAIAEKIDGVFKKLYEAKFPIQRVVPVGNEDDWLDEKAMQANKTSAYAPRLIPGSGSISEHALGMAVDLNPEKNPCFHPDGTIEPAGATYDSRDKGAISRHTELGLVVVTIFNDAGFEWGGNWRTPKRELPEEFWHHSAIAFLPDVPADYQHFQLDDDGRAARQPADFPVGFAA